MKIFRKKKSKTTTAVPTADQLRTECDNQLNDLRAAYYKAHTNLFSAAIKVITDRGVVTLFNTGAVKEQAKQRINESLATLYDMIDEYNLVVKEHNEFLLSNVDELFMTLDYQPIHESAMDVIAAAYKHYYKR